MDIPTASKRRPIGYGNDDTAPTRPMPTTPAREASKEFAAESPRPMGDRGSAEESRAGRQELGSELLGVSEEHFNRERKRDGAGKGRKK